MNRFKATGRFRLRVFHLSGACVAAVACTAVLASPALADVTEVSGGAVGVSAQVDPIIGGNISLGPLANVSMLSPPGGLGPFSDTVASASLPGGLLSTGIINADTEGADLGSHQGSATSSASVDQLNVASGAVTASTVASECKSNGDGSTGSSTLETAKVLGLNVALNPPPNTTINLPGIGSVVLNEQIRPTDGAGDTSIIVRAIHVKLNGLLGTGDIIVAESRCGARGPDVVPVAPMGLIGVTALLGLGFAGMQWKKRRHNPSVAASTH